MKNAITAFMQEWGFDNFSEFISSSFGFLKPNIFILSVSLGGVALAFESFIGLTALVYCAFALLLMLEFFTGIQASLHEGIKIDSHKWQRVILKLAIYTLIIGIINIFKEKLEVPVWFGTEINIYAWIYYTILNLFVVQLLLSVLENLSRMGYDETSAIFRAIKNGLHRWFKLELNERGNGKKK